MLPGKNDSWLDNPADTNVVAHECGHMFNFPDEYWEFGGWVHKMYIKNNELDFETGEKLNGNEVWQMRSSSNLMGYGALNAIKPGPKSAPSATVSPHYLEYIRRHFCELTHKTWRIGYEM
ncbi:type IV secretion protein Rhs [Caballeronia sordidicola]|uniref:Type IV secretion protein Rhs n=1 Tax=Caballeronia sordidicola TaxID=196367 RepID=A0A158IJ53_CABSO|nr:type IV secretion protein Rhs [Caballeronia sordidicola]